MNQSKRRNEKNKRYSQLDSRNVLDEEDENVRDDMEEEKTEDVGVDGGRFSLASGVAERWVVSRTTGGL
jgi:hypothetical protein